MFVVAYLYNSNGMASWCWEAAHALHELDQPVLLVASRSVTLPGQPRVEVLRLDDEPESAPRRAAKTLVGTPLAATPLGKLGSRLSVRPQQLLLTVHRELERRGIAPRAYLLNQSSLLRPEIATPQLVAGWAWPPTLTGYLSKILLFSSDLSAKAVARSALDAAGWWRRDWHAYRTATRVLAVSAKLHQELRRRGVPSVIAHPGTQRSSVPPPVPPVQSSPTVRILMAAAGLDEPRKRIGWMLEAMQRWKPGCPVELQLAGSAGDALRRKCERLPWKCEFLGRIERERLQSLMRGCDLFCFGSRLDDWGYVLVEAMGQGLAVVAPNQSPFNEIVNGSGFLYRPADSADFLRAADQAIGSNLAKLRQQSWERAGEKFSRESFARALLAAVEA